MCGRYSLTTPVDGIRRLFGFQELPNLPPRYNIAPTQAVLAVLRGDGLKDQEAADGAPRARLLRWGLIPSWSKDPAIASKLINARSETVREKPSFKKAFQRRRCLMPADGFYEWKTIQGRKQPFRIRFADGEPFAFAGLWERWQAPDGGEIESCSILTAEAAPQIAAIHHRMPVILDPAAFDAWLGAPQDAAEALLGPYRGTRALEAYPVDRRVNDVRNDDEGLIAPVALSEPEEAATPEGPAEPEGPRRAGGQLSLF